MIFPQLIIHAVIHVNTNATSEKASVSVTLDTFLLVMDLVVSDVLLLTSLVTAKRLYYLLGMLLYAIMTMAVCQMFAVEQ